MPEWRNGRRDRLKICFLRGSEGSSPFSGSLGKSRGDLNGDSSGIFCMKKAFLCMKVRECFEMDKFSELLIYCDSLMLHGMGRNDIM